jgi:hypothetical protein
LNQLGWTAKFPFTTTPPAEYFKCFFCLSMKVFYYVSAAAAALSQEFSAAGLQTIDKSGTGTQKRKKPRAERRIFSIHVGIYTQCAAGCHTNLVPW